MCALAGATLLVVGSYADTANNSFASVSGDGVVADGESGFCIENVEGSVNVTVGERPGWKCEKGTPFSYDHNEGDVDYFKFYGLDDEESVTIAISNIWVCVHDTTNNEEHVSAPGAVIPDSVHKLGAYFWPKEKGYKLHVSTNMTIVGTLGHHTNKVFAVPCPNPKCDYGKKENPIGGNDVEIDPSPVIAYLNSGNLQEDGSLLLECGEHTIGYTAHYTNDCKDCEFEVSFDYLRIDVCKVESTAEKYIGLDRTDAGYGKDHTITGAVSLTHAPGGVRCLWTVKPHCKIDGNDNEASVLAKVKRIAGEVPGGWDFEYSDSYEQEHLMCEVKLKDGCNPPCESGAGTENDFTIVKVDVTIDDVPETVEEKDGAFTYYVPDDDAPIWAEEWTNSLKDVSITCEPHDGEMSNQIVKLDFPVKHLYVENEDGTYVEAKESYTVKELNKTKFKLHGHKKSEKYKDKEIVAEHVVSHATDTAKFTVFGRPWLVPDYDRKNGIDGDDIAKAKEGKTVFRFWINDDKDYGEDCPGEDYNSDLPGKGNNFGDSKVNGRRDLEDFTPIWIMHGKVKKEDGAESEDDGEIWPDETPPEFIASVTWKLESPHVNAVQTGMFTTEAGDFQHSPKVNCGNNMQKAIEEADIVKESFTRHFIEVMEQEPLKGIFIMEGSGVGSNLVLRITTPKGETVTKASLPLVVSSVNDMYRWINLRGLLDGNNIGEHTVTNEPTNRPDAECNGKHVVFVHGYNTNAEEARSMAGEMFKRLWQSGLKTMFTAVDWFGDKGQIDTWDWKGTITPEYYAAVFNAFKVSGKLSSHCAMLPGVKVMMAHSLGNVLVSAAAKDHGLAYSKYIMINGAVAQEAFDEDIIEDDMIDGDWKPGGHWAEDKKAKLEQYRSSRWYELFDPPDFRRRLSWKGRFSGLHDVVNYYAKTDEVVGDPASLLLNSSAWVQQECRKGTSSIKGICALSFGGWNLGCEAGWGINTYYALNPIYYVWPVGFLRTSGVLTREDVIIHPLFTPFRNAAAPMHSTELFPEDGREPDDLYLLRALFLSDAIPAESHAMGANELKSGCTNVPMLKNIANENTWPHTDSSWTNLWLKDSPLWYHADVKNLAYFYVYKVFDKMTKEME